MRTTGKPRRARLALSLAMGLFGVAGAAWTGFAPAAWAERSAMPLDVLVQRLTDLEGRARDIDNNLKRRPQELSEGEQAARRLTDAEVLYTLRNYDAAATILFDVVDRYPKTAAYADALFYLGDSLYQSRSYLAARRYFEKLVETSTNHPRYQEALIRLTEIALHLQTLDQIDKWLDRLAQVPREKMLAASPYVRGKCYFVQKEYDKAQTALSAILPQSPYFFQARYFIGAIHVARGQLPEAIAAFSVFTPQQRARTDEERRVGELAHLALGRIYYEQGQTVRAHEEYLQISQKSDLFPEALYESAWVAIKAKEYKKALRQLELLVLAQPDALNVPEAKLLMGNLQIRTGEHQPATKWFQRTRDEFDPVRKQLEEAVAQHSDATGYFRDLIRKNLDKFDITVMVPKIAARYMKADKDVSRFAGVAGDVSELRRALAETEDTVGKVERALQGPGRFKVDPSLGAAREGAIETTSELLGLRRQLADRMTEIVALATQADELRRLGELSKRRSDLENDLSRVLSTLGSRSKVEAARAAVNEIDKRAAQLQVHLNSLKQQRQAVEKYYQQTKKQQRISPEQFQKELGEVAAQEETAQGQYDQLRKDLQDAMALAESEGQQVESGNQLQKDYAQAVREEQEMFSTLRQRLTGNNRARADQVGSAFDRAFALDQQILDLLSRVNGLLDVKLAEVQAGLLVEKENLKGYRQALDSCSNDTEEVGGGILGEVLKGTAKRFYDIVVRADVGIIDVAWAVKQQRTDKISRLVREQKRELKLLDDEFKEVLKE